LQRFGGATSKLNELPDSFPELKGKKCVVQVGERHYRGEVLSLSWDKVVGLFRLHLAHAELVAACADCTAAVGDWLYEHRTNEATQVFYSPESPGNLLSLATGAELIVVQSADFVL